jgi:hypothetical protein
VTESSELQDDGGVERRDVAHEIEGRLRSRGVHLTGRESDEDLVRIVEAVERFEKTVERHGGDLMVDEPVNGDSPREPDDPRFVLPTRSGNESVDTFITRVVMATERATR